MTLTAPRHLQGPMRNYPDLAVLQERNQWCADRLEEGRTIHELKKALGISAGPIYAAARSAGYVKVHKKNRPQVQMGKKFLSEFQQNLSDEVKNWLNASCPKSVTMGEHVASIIVDAYFDEMSEMPTDTCPK